MVSDWSKKANLVPLAKVTSEGWQIFSGTNKEQLQTGIRCATATWLVSCYLKVKVSNCGHLHFLTAVLANTQVQLNNLLLCLYAVSRYIIDEY